MKDSFEGLVKYTENDEKAGLNPLFQSRIHLRFFFLKIDLKVQTVININNDFDLSNYTSSNYLSSKTQKYFF